MLFEGPQGYIPGHYFSNPSHTTAETFQSLKTALSERYTLPLDSYLHYSELLAAKNGQRSLPIKDVAVHLRILYLLGKRNDPDMIVLPQPIGRYRCPRIMHEKLNLFLVLHGKPLLIHHRPNQDYSLFYITYCCAILDPGNNTLWCEDKVTIPTEVDVYSDILWIKKKENMEYLRSIGFNPKDPAHHNSYLSVRHNGLNRDKAAFLESYYPSNAEEYKKSYQACKTKILQRLSQLSSQCYIIYRADKLGSMQKSVYSLKFKAAMMVAGVFDPYMSSYPEGRLSTYLKGDILIKYATFKKFADNIKDFCSALETMMSKKAPQTNEPFANLPQDFIENLPMTSGHPPAQKEVTLATTFSTRDKRSSNYKANSKAAVENIQLKRSKEKTMIEVKLEARGLSGGNFISAALHRQGEKIVEERSGPVNPQQPGDLGKRKP